LADMCSVARRRMPGEMHAESAISRIPPRTERRARTTVSGGARSSAERHFLGALL